MTTAGDQIMVIYTGMCTSLTCNVSCQRCPGSSFFFHTSYSLIHSSSSHSHTPKPKSSKKITKTSTPHSTSPHDPPTQLQHLAAASSSTWEEQVHRRLWKGCGTQSTNTSFNSSSSLEHGGGDDGVHGVQGQVWMGVHCVYALCEKEGKCKGVRSGLCACEERSVGSVGGVGASGAYFFFFLVCNISLTSFSSSSLLTLM